MTTDAPQEADTLAGHGENAPPPPPPSVPAVGPRFDQGVRPWGWHAGDGTPAHPADRVAQWPAHNRDRMRQAVYAEADTLALADQVLTLNNALREISEEWAGAECGEPVHAQEAYAIALAKRMYSLAAEALRHSGAAPGVEE